MALLNKKSGGSEQEDGGATRAGAGTDATPAAEATADPAPVAAEEKPAEEKPAAERPPAAEKKPAAKKESHKADGGGERSAGRSGEALATLRTRLAQVVWLVCVVAALFLAVGALCVALGANKDNSAVQFILDGAKFFDLDVFSRSHGIKTFDGAHAAVKNALFNWGIAAVLYLVVGRILERIIRP